MADINIYGTLKNATPDATIATADQIQDLNIGKKQEDINREVDTRISTLEDGQDAIALESYGDGKDYNEI